MKKRIFVIMLSCIVITFAYFCLDINNVIAGMGIPTHEINWDIASIVISNLVVICLYLITFNLLDNRSIEKDKNQRDVAILILNKTYEQCKEVAGLLDNPSILASVVKKCDFKKTIYEDPIQVRFLEAPFEFHDKIVELASTGVISKQEFSDYADVRAAYKSHINMRITFFDAETLGNAKYLEFIQTLEKAKDALNRGEHNARL